MAYSPFPPLEPFNSFRLKVSDLHEIYVEQAGNPRGQPAVFLHGGPGAGLSVNHRRLFDPRHYRVILFDQRGAGRSTPHAELRENSTWDLVADMEAIRRKLNIEKWLVFGGSWGSTLALAYGETHPDRVSGLILRGIFLCRKEEIQWFYQGGCHQIFPDFWEKYVEMIPLAERADMVSAYYRLLTDANEKIRLRAAKAWSGWEASTLRLIPDPVTIAEMTDDHKALSIARIECHYFVNKCFFTHDDQLINNAHRLRSIPGVIVHGRYDVVCPVKNAWDLHRAWPETRLEIIPTAGHAYDEPGILNALVGATEQFKG